MRGRSSRQAAAAAAAATAATSSDEDASSSQGSEGSFPFPVVPCWHASRGDGFAAQRDMEAGQLVMRVAPLAAVPKDGYISTVCAGCFRHSGRAPGALKLCTLCNAASFCTRCSNSSWLSHRHAEECQALGDLLQMQDGARSRGRRPGTSTSGRMSRELRMLLGDATQAPSAINQCATLPASTEHVETATLRLLLLLAIATARERSSTAAEQPSDEAFGTGDVIQDGVAELEGLVGDPEQDLDDAMAERFADACCVLKEVQPAWARASMDAYVRWATKLHRNSHDICVLNVAPTCKEAQQANGKRLRQKGSSAADHEPRHLSRPGTTAVGEGLFPSVARLNHSCEPNVTLAYDAYGCLEVYVSKGMHISAGEELLVAYVSPSAPRDLRRQHLYDRYGFWCECPRCLAGK